MKIFYFTLLFFAMTQLSPAQKFPSQKNSKVSPYSPKNNNACTKENFSVLRNPSSTNFIVFYDNPEVNSFGVEITNDMGQVIFHKSYAVGRPTIIEEIDLRGNNRGVYYIEIICPEKQIVKKIILN